MTSPAPARMSVARTGAPESRSRPRTTAWWPSVGCPRRAGPSRCTNMNRPSKMFSVISEAPVADRGQPDRHRQQVGGEARERQRDHVDRLSGGRSIAHPERVAAGSRPAPPADDQLVQGDLQEGRVDPVDGHVAAGHRRAERPGAGDDAVADGGVARPARARSTPSTLSVDVPAPSIRAPIAVSIAQMSTISGSRAALSISVTPLASTAAISRFSVAPTLGKSSQIVAPCRPPGADGDDEPVLAGDLGAHPGQAGDVHVQPARADRVAARVRDPHVPAAGQQRAEHADRGAQPAYQVVVGLGARLAPARRSPPRRRRPAVERLDAAAEPPQHLGHDRDVGDPRHVGDHGAARRQQRGRHQLERGVLRADHPYLAGQPGAALDPDHIHVGPS